MGMSQISHEIRHGLPQADAKRAAQRAMDEYLSRYADRGMTAHWSSETRAEIKLAVRGVHVEATVDVLPEVLRVEASVPLLLRPFKGAAIAAVEREAQKWIAEVKAEAAQ
jgi:hypothetical protein